MAKAPSRLLVIGGRGFLGARVVRACAAAGFRVAVGSRGGERKAVAVNLNDPGSFGPMADFDLVVDCADAALAPPDAAIAWCGKRGIPFVETTAHPATVRRLLDLPEAGGFFLLGMGLFPGVSNLLAAEVARRGQGRGVVLGVRLSLLAGAGAGMCAVIGDALAEAPEGPGRPFAPCGPLPFVGGGRRAWRLGLAEGPMLRRSLGRERVQICLATRPPLPLSLAAFLPRRLAAAAARRLCLSLRAGLLRHRDGPAELAAATIPENPASEEPLYIALRCRDAMGATAWAIAAALRLLAERDRLPTGLFLPDQLFTLEAILSRMRRLGGEGLLVETENTRG